MLQRYTEVSQFARNFVSCFVTIDRVVTANRKENATGAAVGARHAVFDADDAPLVSVTRLATIAPAICGWVICDSHGGARLSGISPDAPWVHLEIRGMVQMLTTDVRRNRMAGTRSAK